MCHAQSEWRNLPRPRYFPLTDQSFDVDLALHYMIATTFIQSSVLTTEPRQIPCIYHVTPSSTVWTDAHILSMI